MKAKTVARKLTHAGIAVQHVSEQNNIEDGMITLPTKTYPHLHVQVGLNYAMLVRECRSRLGEVTGFRFSEAYRSAEAFVADFPTLVEQMQ